MFDKDREIICLLCEETFEHPKQEKEFLRHLTFEHKFIIGNVEMISDLPTYIDYWRNKFKQAKLITKFCSVVSMTFYLTFRSFCVLSFAFLHFFVLFLRFSFFVILRFFTLFLRFSYTLFELILCTSRKIYYKEE